VDRDTQEEIQINGFGFNGRLPVGKNGSWSPKKGWNPASKPEKPTLLPCRDYPCNELVMLYERVAWMRWLILGNLSLSMYVAGRLAGLI
jgi:hypothetical protein